MARSAVMARLRSVIVVLERGIPRGRRGQLRNRNFR